MAVKLNAPTSELVKIDVERHPLFDRLWADPRIRRVGAADFEAFRATPGIAVLCIADDPVMFKETIDMAAIAPELMALFEDALAAGGFTDPAEGRAIARGLGVNRLPAVALFRSGETLGVIEGLQSWADYERKLVEILLSGAPRRRTIRIAAASAEA